MQNRKQKTENRKQKTENRKQKTENGKRKTEKRKQITDKGWSRRPFCNSTKLIYSMVTLNWQVPGLYMYGYTELAGTRHIYCTFTQAYIMLDLTTCWLQAYTVRLATTGLYQTYSVRLDYLPVPGIHCTIRLLAGTRHILYDKTTGRYHAYT